MAEGLYNRACQVMHGHHSHSKLGRLDEMSDMSILEHMKANKLNSTHFKGLGYSPAIHTRIHASSELEAIHKTGSSIVSETKVYWKRLQYHHSV